MELHTVIAVSTMDSYCACIPYFIQSWKHLFPEVRVIVLLISSALPSFLKPYASHIELIPRNLFPEYISTADIARQLRFFYPSYYHLLSERYRTGLSDNILVSNIDTIPCSKTTFMKALELYEDNMFVQMLDTDLPELSTRFPVRYCIGKSELWNKIFKAQCWDDIYKNIQPRDSLEYFRELILHSEIYPSNVRIAGNGNIDYSRLSFQEIETTLRENPANIINYSDYTLPLPMANYVEKANLVLKSILMIKE